MINIITCIILIIILVLLLYFCYCLSKKDFSTIYEKVAYLAWCIVLLLIFGIYFLDRYNIPTELEIATNVNTQNWLNVIVNYTTTILNMIVTSAVSIYIAMYQIRKNIKESIQRDTENLRIQNMPILKYYIDSENRAKDNLDALIITNSEDEHRYNLNISIKNVGTNTIKNIKMDIKAHFIDNSLYRIFGKNSVEVLEKGEKIEVNRYFSLDFSKKPYEIFIIVYYEDVLSNWYRQILKVKYIATSICDGDYIGIVDYTVEKEEVIKKEDVEINVL